MNDDELLEWILFKELISRMPDMPEVKIPEEIFTRSWYIAHEQ
jgi:hypothetical protein